MGKYNKKPKLRSVTRTRSKKRKGVDRIVKEQDLIVGGGTSLRRRHHR